jgi:hypothetical protein
VPTKRFMMSEHMEWLLVGFKVLIAVVMTVAIFLDTSPWWKYTVTHEVTFCYHMLHLSQS